MGESASGLADESSEEWDRLRFGQLIDTYRTLTGSLASFVLGLSLGLVTILGFAVDRESWGLAAVALIFEAMILVVMMRFKRGTNALMDVAAVLEARCCGEQSATEAHRGLMAPNLRRARLEWAVAAVATTHLVLVILLATVFNWTFAGS